MSVSPELNAMLPRLVDAWRYPIVTCLSGCSSQLSSGKVLLQAGIQSCLNVRLLARCEPEADSNCNGISGEQTTTLMAKIYPFRAWRCNASTVRLDDVVPLPYDPISPVLPWPRYQRGLNSLIRIIQYLPGLFDAQRKESVYTRAEREFSAWRRQGICIQGMDPCVFAYSKEATARAESPGDFYPKLLSGLAIYALE